MFTIKSFGPSLRFLAPVLVSWWCLTATPSGQTPSARPRPPASSSTMVFVHVRDTSGHPLAGVRLQVDGAASGEFTTDGEGVVRLSSMRDGAYHLRFERKGFIELERELSLRGGQPDVIDVALAVAPPDSAPPSTPATASPRAPSASPAPAATSARPATAAPPAPASPPQGQAQRPPPAAARPALTAPPPAAGDQKTLSIPTFLDRNFIGREPLKESILGCTPTATTRLLQLRDSLAEHVHADVDESLYVVAGEGSLLVPNQAPAPIAPGSLSIVPRGAPHAIERRGKNPLILLSTLSGVPCAAETGVPK
jgi:mannose-6-phosphate isomerase-like protein (cupin superfamily)